MDKRLDNCKIVCIFADDFVYNVTNNINTKQIMKLSKAAIEAIQNKDVLRLRNRLSLELDVHSATVERWARDNDDDNRLTTVTALQIISEETGLSQEEILINVNSAA